MHQTDEWWVSHFNFCDAVKANMKLPEEILLNDVTLREGEQAGNVVLRLEERLAIAKKFDEIGVQQIQIGFADLHSESERNMIKSIKKELTSAKIEALVLGYYAQAKEQIDILVDCGVDVITIALPSSDMRLKVHMKISREELINKATDMVAYAKNRGVTVMYLTTDTTRSDLAFLKKIYKCVVDAGADRVGIADTAGVISPQAMNYLTCEIKEELRDIPVGVHCHNDFGLAMANVVAAVQAGAEIVDVAGNGLGERAGMPALDEVIMTLKILYGVKSNIKTEMLYELSNLVAKLTNTSIPPSKPITGENVFAHVFDSHVLLANLHPFFIQPFKPELVGNKSKVVLSRYTGVYAIKEKIKELGITLSEDKMPLVAQRVREKALKEKRALTDDEFLEIIGES